jgi:hypothetical protein
MKKILVLMALVMSAVAMMGQIKVDFPNSHDVQKTSGSANSSLNSSSYEVYYDINYEIGEAFKVVGSSSIAIGVPCLASGTILMALGFSNVRVGNGNAAEQLVLKSRLATAGSILFPIGASLTIVGVPLYIKGNEIIYLSLNYTGNGVGVGVEF